MEIAAKQLVNYFKQVDLDLCVLFRKGVVPASLADMPVDPNDLLAVVSDPNNVYVKYVQAGNTMHTYRSNPVNYAFQVAAGDLKDDVFVGKWAVPYYVNETIPENASFQYQANRIFFAQHLQKDVKSINDQPSGAGPVVYMPNQQWIECMFYEPVEITAFTLSHYFSYGTNYCDMEIMNEEGEWVRPIGSPTSIGNGNMRMYVTTNDFNDGWRTVASSGRIANGTQYNNNVVTPSLIRGIRLRGYGSSGWINSMTFYADSEPTHTTSSDFSDITHAIMYPLKANGGVLGEEMAKSLGPILVTAGGDPSNDIVINNPNDPIKSVIDFDHTCGLRLEGFY